jgi:hypothetical protein
VNYAIKFYCCVIQKGHFLPYFDFRYLSAINNQNLKIMKKNIQLVVMVLLLSIPTFVQAQGVGFGLKGGVNFANQSITNITTESMTGYHGGAYFVFAFSENWGLQPEVIFSSQGAELPEFNETNKFNYLSIPILLRWKPLSFLSIEGGPQFSYLLNAEDNSGNSLKDEIKKSDFGMAAGVTLHAPIGLNGGVRYIYGFTNISNLENDHEVKNKVIQLFVGWTIFGSGN